MSYNVPTDYVVIIGDDFNERGFIYQSDVIYIQNISVVLDLQQHFGNNQQSVSEHELCLNQRSEFSLQTAARSFRAAYWPHQRFSGVGVSTFLRFSDCFT
eukprot:147330_1